MFHLAGALRDDLRGITGRTLPVALGVGPGRAGDLRLAIDPALPAVLGDEGYRLEVAGTPTVRGRTPTGVARGAQTVEQLFALDPGRAAVPRGTADDWPETRQRGFMLDAGRKYYRPDCIEQQIRTAAWLKLNTVHPRVVDEAGAALLGRLGLVLVGAAPLPRRTRTSRSRRGWAGARSTTSTSGTRCSRPPATCST
ncbi:glycoside hydrolase family 20 zincin-like fold domain-containing protein [Actinomadura chibensis]|uniref:glycoside hydrolase family 20 zincin-like fold domain-containing protein n=1 Tax=Actinomadura chibensis TaxID=392828 RepID=UPI0008375D43|nr:glycoside hydrolase family 20 zincin-like fold domain-containing protein [Actinomadura chibensis]